MVEYYENIYSKMNIYEHIDVCLLLNKNSNIFLVEYSSLPSGPEAELCKDFPVVNSAQMHKLLGSVIYGNI